MSGRWLAVVAMNVLNGGNLGIGAWPDGAEPLFAVILVILSRFGVTGRVVEPAATLFASTAADEAARLPTTAQKFS